VRSFFAILIITLLVSVSSAQVQKITINAITVEGNKTAVASSVRRSSGLISGMEVTGEDMQQAIKNLWKVGIFEDVQLYVINQTIEGIDILIKVKEYPRLEIVNITGTDELDEDEIEEAITTFRGMVITPYKISQMKKKIKKKYYEEGFLLAEIKIDTSAVREYRVNLDIVIDEGSEVQVEGITFHDNNAFVDDDLKDAMEHTQKIDGGEVQILMKRNIKKIN